MDIVRWYITSVKTAQDKLENAKRLFAELNEIMYVTASLT